MVLVIKNTHYLVAGEVFFGQLVPTRSLLFNFVVGGSALVDHALALWLRKHRDFQVQARLLNEQFPNLGCTAEMLEQITAMLTPPSMLGKWIGATN